MLTDWDAPDDYDHLTFVEGGDPDVSYAEQLAILKAGGRLSDGPSPDARPISGGRPLLSYVEHRSTYIGPVERWRRIDEQLIAERLDIATALRAVAEIMPGAQILED